MILLGQIAVRLPVIDVACNRCDRSGRLNIARLVAEQGTEMPVAQLLRVIAAECLRMRRVNLPSCPPNIPGAAGQVRRAGTAAVR